MSEMRPISEDDLQAYVDGALPPARRAEVEQYLHQHPAIAARVQGYINQNTALRAALDPIAEEPIPPALNLRHLIETQRRPQKTISWRAAAAAVLMFTLGGAGGWSAHSMAPQPQPNGISVLAQEAANTYAVYGDDHVHPVDFKATDSAALVSWVSQRLGTHVPLPDLSAAGYHFMGGSLVPTNYGPAGMLMYDNGKGSRLVMYLRPMKIDNNQPTMREHATGEMTSFTWSKNGIGYSVIGAAAPEVLHPLANQVREQIETGI